MSNDFSGGKLSFCAAAPATADNDSKTVSTLRTSMPDIVDWKFADKQRQVIVKSRGKQGGAVVELFNTRTGTLQDKVQASEIKKSRESWAKGFED